MLFTAPTLDADEERVLEETEELRRRLRYLMGEPRRWSGSLRKVALAVAVQSSNTIEGYTVTLEQARPATSTPQPPGRTALVDDRRLYCG